MTTGGEEEEKKKTACVTGGNGYIASALIKVLLEKGYVVKTTVRNPGSTSSALYDIAKNSHFKDLQALGPLEVFRADLDEEGSFDDAVAGCDYAFLVAAPVNLTSDNPEVNPFSIVNYILDKYSMKSGTVRRVVLTSSAGAVCIRLLEGDGHVLDEESWSDLNYFTAEKPPIWVCDLVSHAYPVSWDTSPYLQKIKTCTEMSVSLQGYVVSKVFMENISLVSLCSILTIGSSPVPKVYTSVLVALSLLFDDKVAFEMLKGIEKAYGGVHVVDLDHLCRAQLLMAETETASGRYVCCGFNTTVVEMTRFLARKYRHYNVVNTDDR
ncbi:hypothetical protein PR202_ga18925 [Eleusine coracana subsp. coracana]|uniref:NmrA-like domain-containing protein n=1 Tax=Eleusine coracana subsp. coracana TaxID=191504 RepID=A0AAV5CV29_ELECO|nr:hypothetical protein PR202_ga18925 [Eleusine coracana subsp. coracana]